jgi:hypothetical protein
MEVGLNAGFGEPLAHELPTLAQYGFVRIRQDLYAANPATVPALVQEFVGAPVLPLFLIGGGHIEHADHSERLEPHELAAMTAQVVDVATGVGLGDYQIEIGNEPDIAHPGYAEHPEDFAEAMRQSAAAARAHGFTGPVLSGGVSNLNTRGLRYLARMLRVPTFPADVVVGFHRYPEAGRGALAPHRGFSSREDEWGALTGLTVGFALACTEFGYSTAHGERTDELVTTSVLWDLDFYTARGVTMALVYQLNDGPGEDTDEKYGMRTFDGVWKPVAEQIRERYGPQ